MTPTGKIGGKMAKKVSGKAQKNISTKIDRKKKRHRKESYAVYIYKVRTFIYLCKSFYNAHVLRNVLINCLSRLSLPSNSRLFRLNDYKSAPISKGALKNVYFV